MTTSEDTCATEAAQPSGDADAPSPAGPTGPTLASPWIISIAVHALLFTAMFVLVFPYSPNAEADLPVTRAELVGDPNAAAPGGGSTVWREPDLRGGAPTSSERLEMRFAPTAPSGSGAALGTAGLLKRPDASIIGIGGGAIGSGEGAAGYGPGIGGGGAEFFGLGRSAPGVRRIVYVVDRSGSMSGTFDYVREELKRSVSALRRAQKFHVILFSAGETLESPPKELVSAITAAKNQLFEFLAGVTPGGATEPEPAMGRAFRLEPDIIYFLTDGEFSPTLLGKLEVWNKDRKVRIFTIAFFGADGAELLERIAREHGGEYKYISEADLP